MASTSDPKSPPPSTEPPSTSPSEYRPPLVTRLSPVKRRASARRLRLTASTLLLIGSIVLVVSMAVSWWGFSSTGAGASETIQFYPGSTYWTASSAAGTVSALYTTGGLVHVGQLYEAILGLGVTAAIAGFVATALGYLGVLAGPRGRAAARYTFLFALVGFVAAIVLPPLAAGAQPGALTTDGTATGGGGGCPSGSSPCSSFWGSLSANGVHVGWGADVGWYLAVVAIVLFFLALWQLWAARGQPWAPAPSWTPPPAAAPSPAAPVAAPAPQAAWAETNEPAGPQVPPNVPTGRCPRCGGTMAWAAPYSRWYCLTERKYL